MFSLVMDKHNEFNSLLIRVEIIFHRFLKTQVGWFLFKLSEPLSLMVYTSRAQRFPPE